MMFYLACARCGSVVGDVNAHIRWHIEAIGDVEPGDGCPLEGAETSIASASDRGGVTTWQCGHAYRWGAE